MRSRGERWIDIDLESTERRWKERDPDGSHTERMVVSIYLWEDIKTARLSDGQYYSSDMGVTVNTLCTYSNL